MLLCRISCELAGCVHQHIVGSGQTNLSHLYFSRLSLAKTAKLNFFKTPTSVWLVQVGPCLLPLEYQAATSHTGRQPCRARSLYMKRFWSSPSLCVCGRLNPRGIFLKFHQAGKTLGAWAQVHPRPPPSLCARSLSVLWDFVYCSIDEWHDWISLAKKGWWNDFSRPATAQFLQ